MSDELLYIGQLGKSVGLQGKMKLHLTSDFASAFKKGHIFYDNKKTPYTLEHFDVPKSQIKLQNIDTIEQAKALCNTLLYQTKEQTKASCSLGQDEFFYFDIVGCEIVENNELLGVVSEIERFNEIDYLLIQTATDLVEQEYAKSFLIPYNDEYVLSVSIEKKMICTDKAFVMLENS